MDGGLAHIPNEEVEEQEDELHHDGHEPLQLAHHGAGVLQGGRQVGPILHYAPHRIPQLLQPAVQ